MASEMVKTLATGMATAVPHAARIDSSPSSPRYLGVVYRRGAGTSVGMFDDTDTAWEAARKAARADDAFGYTIEEVDSGRVEGRTIADARRLVAALREYADQSIGPDHSKVLTRGLDLLEQTLVRGWTEVDEALVRLAMSKKEKSPDRAADLCGVAVGMLHRWQGRNGRVGNVG